MELIMANIYTSSDAANAAATTNERVIPVRWKSPARSIWATIPNAAFVAATAECPAAYEALIHAVLEDSAKRIIRRHYENSNFSNTVIADACFTRDALIEEATSSHTDWLTKDELTALWEKSATRARIINDARYRTSTEYRRVANHFSDLVLKFAGKTSQFTPRELDAVLAKLNDEDLSSELGAFIIRRVEAIRNKPQAEALDLDLL
jgi:hypothetical protein